MHLRVKQCFWTKLFCLIQSKQFSQNSQNNNRSLSYLIFPCFANLQCRRVPNWRYPYASKIFLAVNYIKERSVCQYFHSGSILWTLVSSVCNYLIIVLLPFFHYRNTNTKRRYEFFTVNILLYNINKKKLCESF